jgi:hypothetical protein
VVLFLLETDAAFTGLNGHCGMKNAVFCFYNYAIKQKMIENRFCEDTDCLQAILRSGMTILWVMVSLGKV